MLTQPLHRRGKLNTKQSKPQKLPKQLCYNETSKFTQDLVQKQKICNDTMEREKRNSSRLPIREGGQLRSCLRFLCCQLGLRLKKQSV